MRKIKTVQIGIGHDHASAAFATLKKLPDEYEITGYMLPPTEKERFLQKAERTFAGYPELTLEQICGDESIEAAVIETEEVSLTDYALLCSKAGKHIQMDKPGGLDPAAYEEMLRIMKQKGLVFHTGYMYRYNSTIMRLMERIQKGELGEIFSVEAHMDCRHPVQKRQWLEAFPGGMMFFLGCHLIDLIFGILGTPEEILPMNVSTGIDGVTAKDYGFAVFKYRNGISFAKTCAEEIGGYARRQLVVTGSKGSAELKPLEMAVKGGSDQFTGCVLYTDPAWGNRGEYSESEPRDRYVTMMKAFAEMVRGERENPWSYEYELKLYRTILAACGVDIDYKKDILL